MKSRITWLSYGDASTKYSHPVQPHTPAHTHTKARPRRQPQRTRYITSVPRTPLALSTPTLPSLRCCCYCTVRLPPRQQRDNEPQRPHRSRRMHTVPCRARQQSSPSHAIAAAGHSAPVRGKAPGGPACAFPASHGAADRPPRQGCAD